jgi:triosephosphate isomerase (TIM)
LSTTRKPLIVGNWKMNLNHLEAIAMAQKLAFAFRAKDYEATDIAILPPFTDLRSVQTLINGDKLLLAYGAQDLSPFDSGAYTGDVSGPMLAKLGCTYVLVGHSERRQHHQETDEIVNSKLLAALKSGITPILCVGESAELRAEGRAIETTQAQLRGGLAGVPADRAATVVLAYEPIWAIGTGDVATAEDAQEVIEGLRSGLEELYSSELAGKARILYGGSVNMGNTPLMMAKPDIDGVLVGGASLEPDSFVRIARYRDEIVTTS